MSVKPWIYKTIVLGWKATTVCDLVLLAICWILAQVIIIGIGRGIWRSDIGWHAVGGAIFFVCYAELLWSIAVWCMMQRPLAAMREWRDE